MRKGEAEMSNKKIHSKSIRLTDEVLAYIEQAPGDGFNQKFENIILEAKNGEQERKRRLAYYDKLLEKRKTQLSEIGNRVESITKITNLICKNVDTLQHEVRDIQRDINSFIREAQFVP